MHDLHLLERWVRLTILLQMFRQFELRLLRNHGTGKTGRVESTVSAGTNHQQGRETRKTGIAAFK
jgi:hypothetical protein